jgi:hypothetical protein
MVEGRNDFVSSIEYSTLLELVAHALHMDDPRGRIEGAKGIPKINPVAVRREFKKKRGSTDENVAEQNRKVRNQTRSRQVVHPQTMIYGAFRLPSFEEDNNKSVIFWRFGRLVKKQRN